MRIDVGDAVILTSGAASAMREQGYELSGEVAEVVAVELTTEGTDLVLRFDTSKTVLKEVPLEAVQHIGIC